jgi:protein-L-isoaspartate(D-aspartate) O-methyltransferase
MTGRAADAMRAVPRRGFLPSEQQDDADLDVPLAIGHGATNSQPATVRAMLDLLAPALGDRVLDVGAGSGWTTALLTWLVGPTGRVEAVERVPELAGFARARLARPVHLAEPGVLGWPSGAPYDRILVSAEAAGRVPPSLVEQLAVGGVMVIPVDGIMLRVTRTPDGTDIDRHGRYLFVPLVED